MRLLQTITGHRRSLLGALGCRRFCASAQAPSPAELYDKRNYANNVSEYNTVFGSLTAKRKYSLLRDAYEDMMLDGVQPSRDTFHALIIGTMKGFRMQDAFFFTDEMKSMGLFPDVGLLNFLISLCGKCKNSKRALQIFEEMKKNEVKPTGQTFICLLNACAASGRLDLVSAIVRDMTAAGLGLNKFCYAGLIAAHKNVNPIANDAALKIIELVEQSKGWFSVEALNDTAENVMMGVTEEELYNLTTADYIHRRGFVNRSLTVYHAAFHACADLKNVQAIERLMEMLKMDSKSLDVFITIQIMRCYLHSGYLDEGLQIFENHASSGKAPVAELYATLVEGAMVGYTPKGMQLAQDMLVQMNSRNFYLSTKMGSDLLIVAAGEKTGGYTTANLIWDLMQARKFTPTFFAVDAYLKGLKQREIPESDPRLLQVSRVYDGIRGRDRHLRTNSEQ